MAANNPGQSKGLRPYYLLWGYRKCGTTSLALTLMQSGVSMPDWDENNIWIARSDRISDHLDTLWKGTWDAPYLVDLSTLTHLSRIDPDDFLRPRGFQPVYLVCTRHAAPRWLSAFSHMVRKRTDQRSLLQYLTFYEGFIGLTHKDLRLLEDELIHRDLSQGLKSPAGVLDCDYFRTAYPVGFEADLSDAHYQFRYFGETIDMLEKRPSTYVELPLNDPETSARWISETFGVSVMRNNGPALNRNSLFNTIRHNPNVARLSRHIPRPVRRRMAQSVETSVFLPQATGKKHDLGVERDMFQLVEEMLTPPASSPLETK